MVNILFVTSAAPEKSPFSTAEKRPPLGVGSLISTARQKGHKVFFIDNYLKPENFIEKGFLEKNNIDFVGIHANTICFRDTLKMLSEIEKLRQKKIWKGKIIVGGPHTSVALETIPDYVDYIVQGEGETALSDILEEKSKSIVRAGRIKDINSLPFYPWDIFTKMPYDLSCPWMDISPVFTMNTSRGCPFDCSFCSVGSIWGSKYTCFSASRIISEIEYLVKYCGAKGIYFREDNFTFNRKRTAEFCDILLTKKIGILWACESRVEALCDEDMVRLMSRSGCRAVYLGIESGSPRVLSILNKNIDVSQIEKAISLCNKYKINSYCSLMAGIPGEKYEDFFMTEKLMRRLKPYSYSFNVFVGLPYSRLYKQVIENKLAEFIDGLGLAYLPGFDVKTRYFYSKDSKELVDYDFTQRTDFDKKLLRRMFRRTLADRTRKLVPQALKVFIKKHKLCQESAY